MGDVRDLIQRYQEAVDGIVSALRHAFKEWDLLGAQRRGEIPREGTLGELEYWFHGVGCRAIANGTEVDFDFGPDGRTDGFDAWRLWTFARQNAARYPKLQRREDVEAALACLEASGEIERPRSAPSPHLWYLRS